MRKQKDTSSEDESHYLKQELDDYKKMLAEKDQTILDLELQLQESIYKEKERYDGKMSIESKVGEGTLIKVILQGKEQ